MEVQLYMHDGMSGQYQELRKARVPLKWRGLMTRGFRNFVLKLQPAPGHLTAPTVARLTAVPVAGRPGEHRLVCNDDGSCELLMNPGLVEVDCDGAGD